jgi:hypothetical protein
MGICCFRFEIFDFTLKKNPSIALTWCTKLPKMPA